MGTARIHEGVRQMRFEGLLDRQTRGEISVPALLTTREVGEKSMKLMKLGRRVSRRSGPGLMLGAALVAVAGAFRAEPRRKRHPACRRREAQSGSCAERENLAGDAKGKDAMGRRRESCIHRR